MSDINTLVLLELNDAEKKHLKRVANSKLRTGAAWGAGLGGVASAANSLDGKNKKGRALRDFGSAAIGGGLLGTGIHAYYRGKARRVLRDNNIDWKEK